MTLNRREMLRASLGVASWAVADRLLVSSGWAAAAENAYTLPELPYDYDALEPYIDARTMEIHHSKHHNAYVTNLNNAVEGTNLGQHPVERLIANLRRLPEEIRTTVRNNGGGHANHTLFWKILKKDAGEPNGELQQAIDAQLGGFDQMKQQLTEAALGRFGSGWAWLSVDGDGRLVVHSTPNQDSPIMEGKTPILGIDVWEHAYYLKYQNRRAEYVDAFFSVVNWPQVEEFYSAARQG